MIDCPRFALLWRTFLHSLNEDSSLTSSMLLAGGLEEMTRMQAEASEMEHDSHGLTVLPFFSGGSSSGSNGV